MPADGYNGGRTGAVEKPETTRLRLFGGHPWQLDQAGEPPADCGAAEAGPVEIGKHFEQALGGVFVVFDEAAAAAVEVGTLPEHFNDLDRFRTDIDTQEPLMRQHTAAPFAIRRCLTAHKYIL